MRISDWSSDVCSSDLLHKGEVGGEKVGALAKKAVERSCRLKLGEIGLKQRDIGRLIARRELPRGEIGEIAVELRCISRKDIGGQARKGVGRPATAQEGKISAVKLRLIRSQRRKQAGVRQRFQIGAQRQLVRAHV